MTTDRSFASAVAALNAFYGQRFLALSRPEHNHLFADVAEMIEAENMTGRQAVQTLDNRIGGMLETYAASLTAGAHQWRAGKRNRGAEASFALLTTKSK